MLKNKCTTLRTYSSIDFNGMVGYTEKQTTSTDFKVRTTLLYSMINSHTNSLYLNGYVKIRLQTKTQKLKSFCCATSTINRSTEKKGVCG